MLVIGGLFRVGTVSALFGAVSILVPRIQEKQAQTIGAQNAHTAADATSCASGRALPRPSAPSRSS